MRKKRNFVEGAAYHVTSQTNDREQVFLSPLAQKIMETVLREAKEKFGFKLLNFCIMPTHIHLLILPGPEGNLSQIMHWVKTRSSKRWGFVHCSRGHLWGDRFFARAVTTLGDYYTVMAYIDQNPVKAGLAENVGGWEASGAYHVQNGISVLV